jgi:hypothetical protein
MLGRVNVMEVFNLLVAAVVVVAATLVETMVVTPETILAITLEIILPLAAPAVELTTPRTTLKAGQAVTPNHL